jgi:hypothetical protein
VGILDQLALALDPTVTASQADLEKVPPYLREQLMFPYLSGLGYACDLYLDGGWPSIDAAYDAPPSTTAEILDPAQAGLEPADAPDPATLASPWTVARRDTLGAAELSWLLAAPGGDEEAAIAGADDLPAWWGGGELVLSTDGPRSALSVSLVDRSADGALCDVVDGWYEASFGDDTRTATADAVTFDGGAQAAALRCADGSVRLGIGPDLATATALLG